jgi:hypothetical protein
MNECSPAVPLLMIKHNLAIKNLAPSMPNGAEGARPNRRMDIP